MQAVELLRTLNRVETSIDEVEVVVNETPIRDGEDRIHFRGRVFADESHFNQFYFGMSGRPFSPSKESEDEQ